MFEFMTKMKMDNMEKNNAAAHQQGVDEMFRLHFWGALM